MSIKPDKIAFLEEVADKFRSAIDGNGITKTEAAKILGVSRESLYQYLGAKHAPRSEVLQRACVAWGISLTYKGLQFDASAFSAPRASSKKSAAKQESLFDLLESLGDKNLKVTMIRSSRNKMELKVIVSFAS